MSVRSLVMSDFDKHTHTQISHAHRVKRRAALSSSQFAQPRPAIPAYPTPASFTRSHVALDTASALAPSRAHASTTHSARKVCPHAHASLLESPSPAMTHTHDTHDTHTVRSTTIITHHSAQRDSGTTLNNSDSLDTESSRILHTKRKRKTPHP